MPDDIAIRDPYAIRTLAQLLTLFDAGRFEDRIIEEHRALMQKLRDHLDEHGQKGCQGEITIKLKFALGSQADASMGGELTVKPPKAPPAVAHAFVDDDGGMTLFSPMMRRMQPGPRDLRETPHDPETGEIRDID